MTGLATLGVRYWHKADICYSTAYVRFRGKADILFYWKCLRLTKADLSLMTQARVRL